MIARYLAWRTARARPPVALSARAARIGAVATLVGLGVILVPMYRGYADAQGDAPALAERAEALIAAGRGAEGLGAGRFEMLLAVQDPGYVEHTGLDLSTPGAGITTVTQSLAKRVAFDHFDPGWEKLRQTGYAMGLETRLTKAQIAALWLATVEMGRGPDGWITGFYEASEAQFGAPPAALDRARFLNLVAVLIAPGRLSVPPDAETAERVARIERLLSGACAPEDNGDVWLEGCA